MNEKYKYDRTLGEPDMSQRSPHVTLRVNNYGYELWSETIAQKAVCVHQLLAIAYGNDPGKVFSNGKWQIHHKNEIPWDNRIENLQLMPASEHGRLHKGHGGNGGKIPRVTESWLKDKVINKGLSYKEIADEYDFNKSYIHKKMGEYNLRWDQRWKS